MEFIDDDSDCNIPMEIKEAATTATLELLPEKSTTRYEMAYTTFVKWQNIKCVKSVNEDVILAYISEKAKSLKSSSLWSHFSMLKKTLLIKKNININYPKVVAFLKKKSVGYRPKKSKVFERCEIDKFLEDADDNLYLMMKVKFWNI